MRFLCKSGFTLIELLIVMLIIASTATIGIYSLQFLDTMRITSELQLLHSTCMYLQRKSIATRHEQELIFDALHNCYSFDNSTHQLPSCMKFGYLPNIKGPPSDPKYYISSPITFNRERIIFYPDGTIQAGTAYLIDTKNQLQHALSCGIAGVAHIRLYRYNGAWQKA